MWLIPNSSLVLLLLLTAMLLFDAARFPAYSSSRLSKRDDVGVSLLSQ